MRTRYRIQIGGVDLDTVDKNIYIFDIQHSGLQREFTQQRVAKLESTSIANTYDVCNKVTVTFELHIYDVAKRNEVCQKIAQWAASGATLWTNDRLGQYLPNVICEKFPSIESAKNWTDPLTITFSSYHTPYYWSLTEKKRSITGKNVSSTLSLDGNVGSAFVLVTVKALERFTTLQLSSGSTTLKLTGLDVAAGKQIYVDYGQNRYLRIRMRTPVDGTFTDYTSVLSKLDPSSSDNLQAKCGASNTVKVVANGKVTAEFAARGMWL